MVDGVSTMATQHGITIVSITVQCSQSRTAQSAQQEAAARAEEAARLSDSSAQRQDELQERVAALSVQLQQERLAGQVPPVCYYREGLRVGRAD